MAESLDVHPAIEKVPINDALMRNVLRFILSPEFTSGDVLVSGTYILFPLNHLEECKFKAPELAMRTPSQMHTYLAYRVVNFPAKL